MIRHPLTIRLVLFVAFCCAIVVSAQAKVMGPSGGYDLDDLMAQAEDRYDLTAQDAVLLLENLEVSILPNGDRVTRVHQVAWIDTEMGIAWYADHRVPWNSATSTLHVTALRTWRDGQWWPFEPAISPTAVVETLPFALDRTDDYTTMRETMLLHDGVELPCVMETAYFIVEEGGAADGADDLWIFPQSDPAVRSRFSLTVPAGTPVHSRPANGAPQPERLENTEGSETYVWEMSFVDRLSTPHVDDPAAYAPHVAWSTWTDWKALGDKITSTIDAAVVLTDALKDSVAARIEHEPNDGARAQAIVDFIGESTRPIRYADHYWEFAPRPASRTYETAYGHRLDRAVFAVALFREAGLDADPIFWSLGRGGIDLSVPGLARFEEMDLQVSGDDLHATYDPVSGSLSNPPDIGATLWHPNREDRPATLGGRTFRETPHSFDLTLTLEPDENGGWSGTGYLHATGVLSPYHMMVGLDTEAIGTLGRIAGAVLEGADVQSYNPSTFHRQRVAMGFSLTVSAGETDDNERTALIVGSPSAGVMDNLPHDVGLHTERRSSPVFLATPMTQRTRLRVKVGEREIVRLPESRDVANDVGSFSVSATEDDGWIAIERMLTLTTPTILPEDWPQLRTLLLEETDAGNQTLFLK